MFFVVKMKKGYNLKKGRYTLAAYNVKTLKNIEDGK